MFHAALLWVPLPMNAGGAGEDDMLLVRVRFVEAPRSDAVKRRSRGDERAERNERARQARAEPRLAAGVSKAAPVTLKPVVPTPVLTKPPTEARTRTTSVAAVPARTKPDPEPPQTPRVAWRAESVRPTVEAGAAAARKQRDTGEDARGATGNPLKTAVSGSKREVDGARNIARGTPAEQITAGAAFSPVRYARTVKPRYPRKARRAGWEGTTLLKVLVNPDGAPSRVSVERTSGFHILDEAAVKAVRRWRFHPARRGVASLSSWVRIPVAFRLEEGRR